MYARDAGGASYGGNDNSTAHHLKITIRPRDDPPTIGLPGLLVAWRNPGAAAPYSPARLFTPETCCDFCPGPGGTCSAGPCCALRTSLGQLAPIPARANASGGFAESQALTFIVTHNRPSLFAASPRIRGDGTVELNLVAAVTGSARLRVSVTDASGLSSSRDVNLIVASGIVLLELWLPEALADVSTADLRAAVASAAGVDLVRVALRAVPSSARAPSGALRAHAEAEVLGETFEQLRVIKARFEDPARWPPEALGSESRVSLHTRSEDITSFVLNGSSPVANSSAVALSVPESALVLRGAVRNLRVDGAALDSSDHQVVGFNVQVLRYMAPVGVPGLAVNWTEDSGVGYLFSAPPRVEAVCAPYCLAADLLLHSTDVHGVVEMDVTLATDFPGGVNFTQRVVLTIEPAADPPEVASAFADNLTLVEDGGPCPVPNCTSASLSLPLSEVFFDRDLWYPDADALYVASLDPDRLQASVSGTGASARLEVTVALHQHGQFFITATDSAGLVSDPPLRVVVKHVNHAPFVVRPVPHLWYREDDEDTTFAILDYLSDVDIIDQSDTLAPVDVLTWAFFFDRPHVLKASVSANNVLTWQFQPNQNGDVRVNITATDAAGLSATVSLAMTIEPVPDAPFLQEPPAMSQWEERRGYFCDDGGVPAGTLVPGGVTVALCKEACLEDDRCAGVTFSLSMLREHACRKSVSATSIRDGLPTCVLRRSSADSVVYIRPLGLQLQESQAPRVFDFARLFADVDNCGTMLLPAACSLNPEEIALSANSSDSGRVVPVVNGTNVTVGLVSDWHTIGYAPVIVSIIATDMYGMVTVFEFNVTVYDVNNVPTPVMAPVSVVGNGESVFINITTLQHGAAISSHRVVDADMITDVPGDALVHLSAFIDQTSLATVRVLRFADGGNATSGAQCAGNCSVSPDAKSTICWATDGTWGYCRHVLEIDLFPSQHGKAFITLIAVDARGGVGQGQLEFLAQLLNHPPVFTIPTTFEIPEATLGSARQLAFPNFVTNISLGNPHNLGGDACRFATGPAACGEDVCLRPPARDVGDCWGLGYIGQNLTFHVAHVDGDESVFSVLPEIDPAGKLYFELRVLHFGEVGFEATAVDDGGWAFGGVNATTHPFSINVQAINTPPFFFISPEVWVPENGAGFNFSRGAGVWFMDGFATEVDPGDGETEADQQLTFSVRQVSGTDGLFISDGEPQISPTGTISFSLAPDRHGQAVFEVDLSDDGGLSGAPGETSEVSRFVLDVEQVNQAPVFCMKTADITITEDVPYTDTNFLTTVSPGGSPCRPEDVSTAACECGHVPPSGEELQQSYSFEVLTGGAHCSPFECHDDVHPTPAPGAELSWFYISSRGALSVRACNSGEINVTVVMRDDGGTAYGGIDTTLSFLRVNVVPVNDQPRFQFSRGLNVFVLEGSKAPFPILTNISAGRCELSEPMTFSVIPLAFCVPACSPRIKANQTATPLQDGDACPQIDSPHPLDAGEGSDKLSAAGDASQLFAESSDFELRPDGTLRYSLAEFRHGQVELLVHVTDGCKYYAASVMLHVLPVDSPPTFTLSQNTIELSEDLHMLPDGAFSVAFENLFSAAGPGGWREEDQRLRFVAAGNDLRAFECIELLCTGTTPPVACGAVMNHGPSSGGTRLDGSA